MSPEAFCQLVMADYERQWAAAAGHQERHPLRVKMEHLRDLIGQVQSGHDFDSLLRDGLEGENATLCLLCEELAARWRNAN